MILDLIEMINSFGCHARRQSEVKALFVACFYLPVTPNKVKLIKLSRVSVGENKVYFHWSLSRAGSTISSISRSVPGGEELFNHVEARLKVSNGRNFYLFLKASKSRNWFSFCCRKYLDLNVSFFRKCSKVPIMFLPSKKLFC